MVLHEKDRGVARHDIHGMFRGDIRVGTNGVVIGDCGHERPTYRIRFIITPGRTAAVDVVRGAHAGQRLQGPRSLRGSGSYHLRVISGRRRRRR